VQRRRGVILVAALAVIAAIVFVALRVRREAKIQATWQTAQTRFFDLARQADASVDAEVRARTYVTYWEAKGSSVRERVENCPSCHLGVLESGFSGSDIPRELRTHPDARLLAKHPPATFGCTSCHGGEGTWETPHPRVVYRDTGKGKAWALDADEESMTREPLLALARGDEDVLASGDVAVPDEMHDRFFASLPEVQAGCLKCHAADAELDGAPHLMQGRALFRDLGCGGCHAIARLSPANGGAMPKIAMPLNDIAARLKPSYVLAYLRDPRAMNAGARMPNHWPRGVDDTVRRDETLAIAAFLFDRSERRARGGKAANVALASVVAGASAEDGKLLFDAYGCRACHDDGASRTLAPSLAAAGDAWTEDWTAAWLRDPARLWSGARMPSLRLDRREAASIAKWLGTKHGVASVRDGEVSIVAGAAGHGERIKCPSGGAEMSRAQCGELLVTRHGCVACHDVDGMEAPAAGPSLDGFGMRSRLAKDATLKKLDSPRADEKRAKMPDYDLSAKEIRALMVFLAGLSNTSPRPDFDAAKSPAHRAVSDGAALVRDLGCRGCHEIDGAPPRVQGAPSLMHEGARARPEWLFSFLDRPGENGIRPALHPEWTYGELVPPSKLALRMPSFALSIDDTTALVRFFTARDGAAFPYAPPRANKLTPEDKTASLVTLNAECMRCHYVGELPRERAKTEALGPNLALAHGRLRPAWVKGFLPEHARRPIDAAVGDVLFLLRDGTKLPRAGEEASALVLGLGE